MKKVFTSLFFLALIFSQTNCTKVSTENANSADANLPAPSASIAEANQNVNAINANTKPPETPLPTFNDAGAALAEGDKLFDVNQNEKAVDAYRQATKLNPDLAEAYFKLGVTYALLESEQVANGDVPKEEPTPTKVRAKKSKKSEKDAPVIDSDSDKAFDNAIKAYKKILAKNPKDDVAQYNLGRSYNKLNQDKEAEKALRLAVKLKPEDGEYQTELGAILIKLAHYEEAVGALKKALKIDADNLQAQELLEKAEAGRKRVDFGVDKLVQQQKQNRPPPPQ